MTSRALPDTGIYTVRTLAHQDHRAWEALYRAYGDFYMREATSATLVALWDWLHDPERPIWGLVACDMNGTPCGLAHYQEILSPLRGTAIGHLDDLFVAPEHRGRDVGRTILDHLRTEARRRNWPIVRWITHTDNVHARALYDHVAGPTDWLLYTMDSTKSETVTT